jgi:hypothetical protein
MSLLLSSEYRELAFHRASESVSLVFDDATKHELVKELRQQMAMQSLKTEKKKLKQNYDQQIKQVTHDLLGSVNNLQGYAQRLLDQAGGVVPRHDLVKLLRESNYLAYVINYEFSNNEGRKIALGKGVRSIRLPVLLEHIQDSINRPEPTLSDDWIINIHPQFDQQIAIDGSQIELWMRTLVNTIWNHGVKTQPHISITPIDDINSSKMDMVDMDDSNMEMTWTITFDQWVISDDHINSFANGRQPMNALPMDDALHKGLKKTAMLIDDLGGQFIVRPNQTNQLTQFMIKLPYDLPGRMQHEKLMVQSLFENSESDQQKLEKARFTDDQFLELIDELTRMESSVWEALSEAVITLDLSALRSVCRQWESNYPVLSRIYAWVKEENYESLLSLQERVLDNQEELVSKT